MIDVAKKRGLSPITPITPLLLPITLPPITQEQHEGILYMGSLTSIQLLRAIAAWLVVYAHYYLFFPIYHLYNYQWLGIFGVDIFFVISGFIMFYSFANTMCTAREFFVKRLIRIVPAYWFFTFLLIPLSYIYTKEFSYTDWNLNSLLASLFFIKSANPADSVPNPFLTVGWTLNYEMFFYALLSLCIMVFGRFSFFACTLALIILPLAWDEHWFYGILISQKLLYAFVFGIALGYAYKKTEGRNIPHAIYYIFGIALLIFGVTLFVKYQPFLNSPEDLNGLGGLRLLLSFILVSSLLMLEITLSKLRGDVSRLLRYLGNISYSTYLSHTLIINIILHYIGQKKHSLEWELILLLITSLIIFAISHFSYQYIENGSRLKLLKNKLLGR